MAECMMLEQCIDMVTRRKEEVKMLSRQNTLPKHQHTAIQLCESVKERYEMQSL